MNILFQVLLALLLTFHLLAQAPWPATDGLGRSLPLREDTGPPREDRFVGIFYFVWHGGHSTSGPFDLTEILQQKEPTYGPPGVFHHWGKPELGYYFSRDPFVLRRHASMLSDAGVDFIAIDVTNAFTYDREIDALCSTWIQMRAEGLKTPQITFLTNSSHTQVVEKLYERIYQPKRYQQLWFSWKGKPLLMANPNGLTEQQKAFFTLRRSWAWSQGHQWFGNGKDRWPWLDHSPQTPGWHTKEQPEFMPVCIAQHPISNIGRSHQKKAQPPPNQTQSHRGIYFQEQWDHAIKTDPEVIFITGWNEWVAQRFIKQPGKPPGQLVGAPLTDGDTYFVDCYNLEFSRDAEPMTGGYGDAYYYQMIKNIRRFKGMPPIPTSTTTNYQIQIDGQFDDWHTVPSGLFVDKSGDTNHRAAESWGDKKIFDQTGRNDLIEIKVAREQNSFAFLLKTSKQMTPPTDEGWMNLFIDSDLNPSTGWNGFDYVVNRGRDTKDCTIEALSPNGKTTLYKKTPYAHYQTMLEVKIPILPEWSEGTIQFDFHATDNSPLNDLFFSKGDHAPDRRFNYRYLE